MIYLDYSATTQTDVRVLNSFVEASEKYYANPNSRYTIGVESKEAIQQASLQIQQILNVPNMEIIYTSGASEANNLAIKGIAFEHASKGKHLIVGPFEHSSVVSCFSYLESIGYDVDIAPTNQEGMIDLEGLTKIIRQDTILISIGGVNSETGLRQNIEEIGEILDKYPQVVFHSDLTQVIGKVPMDLTNVDMISFTAHKIYGIKGIGALLKKPHITLTPQIHGGKSTTKYRGGTPSTALILSLAKAIEVAYENFENRYLHVLHLQEYMIEELSRMKGISLNRSQPSIPHIINLSVDGYDSHQVQDFFTSKEIYISTQTACSSNKSFSEVIYRLTKDEERAKSSIRVSISYHTTLQELTTFIHELEEVMHYEFR